jgi:adenylate kinase
MQLSFPADAVVVVAGVPGAGKTTLIRRAVDRREVRVVDTDDRRAEGKRSTPLLYAGH